MSWPRPSPHTQPTTTQTYSISPRPGHGRRPPAEGLECLGRGLRPILSRRLRRPIRSLLGQDMGVAHRRKGSNVLAEAFAPYSADDYADLFDLSSARTWASPTGGRARMSWPRPSPHTQPTTTQTYSISPRPGH